MKRQANSTLDSLFAPASAAPVAAKSLVKVIVINIISIILLIGNSG
ncbi:MAG TPA: hypothetical protein VKA60_21345 [Blastocatellia bacterium]|nr:hypothetical protein [Blastocatellia bacterium]